MKCSIARQVLLLAALVFSPYVFAEDDGSENTLVVVQAGTTPEDIVNTISLPFDASSTAAERSALGLDVAVYASELGGDFGQQIAEEAKSNNISEQIRDDLQQNARRDARGANGQDPPW